MELLETQDPEKKKLIESSDRHRRELEKDVAELSRKTEKMLTNALIIGGSLALTYIAVRSFSGGKKKKKKNKAQAPTAEPEMATEEHEHENEGPSLISQIGSQLLNQATFLLINIAKDKLAEYLQSRKKADENS